ncbi:uncharacterized protein LOC134263814 [Saccostrea cucullata]|uniref:uncharacterized protein LOC134263814 n=1 Tax=Saccostrea cuccullata TaxID=36930 RepID=UPI002ED6C06E
METTSNGILTTEQGSSFVLTEGITTNATKVAESTTTTLHASTLTSNGTFIKLEPVPISVKNRMVDIYDGVVLSGHVIVEQYVSGLQLCAMECLKTVDCHSINFIKEKRVCQLNSASSTDSMSLHAMKGNLFTRKDQWPKTLLGYCQNKTCGPQERCIELRSRAVCIIVNCTKPPTVTDAYTSDSLVHVGSRIAYKCVQGKSPNVSEVAMTIICRGNGQWTAVQFQCV